jgi:hypothetical protein
LQHNLDAAFALQIRSFVTDSGANLSACLNAYNTLALNNRIGLYLSATVDLHLYTVNPKMNAKSRQKSIHRSVPRVTPFLLLHKRNRRHFNDAFLRVLMCAVDKHFAQNVRWVEFCEHPDIESAQPFCRSKLEQIRSHRKGMVPHAIKLRRLRN